jgi:hypothetical protein
MLIVFEKKGIKVFQKKFGSPEFDENIGEKKIIVGFLLSFNSKLNHFDRNLNLNRKWLAGENRYGFDLFRSPWTFRPSTANLRSKVSSKDTFQCTNLCKRCAASSRFRAFRKRDLGRQREDRILVAKEEILHEI